jgi:hypothetical protein
MQKDKPPLFRSVNTTAHRPNVHTGGDYRDERNTRKEVRSQDQRRSMHGKQRRGRDYTPLFKFLLSKVGRPWSEVHSEAVRRLDRTEPIFWLVATGDKRREDYVRVGESSYFSGLYVDEAALLQRVNLAIDASSLVPSCQCCTHTFNGVRFTRPYPGVRPASESGRGDTLPPSQRAPDDSAA